MADTPMADTPMADAPMPRCPDVPIQENLPCLVPVFDVPFVARRSRVVK